MMTFNGLLSSLTELPVIITESMGPFGKTITAPFWILFFPLISETNNDMLWYLPPIMGSIGDVGGDTYIGPLLLIVVPPLWVLFIATIPIFLLVIVAERLLHKLILKCWDIDSPWLRNSYGE